MSKGPLRRALFTRILFLYFCGAMAYLKTGPVFHPVDPSDLIKLQHCLDAARKGISFSGSLDRLFAALCSRRDFYRAEWTLVNDFLVMRACCFGGDKVFYLQPLYVGNPDAFGTEVSQAELLNALRNYSRSLGETFRMACLHVDFARAQSENPDFYVYENRDCAVPDCQCETCPVSELDNAWFLMDKASDEYKIWRLWQEAFDDSDSFLASYIYPYSTPDARILFYEDDDPQKDVVAMCHVHYFDSEFGLAAYLYALAVSKKARGRGLGTVMVKKILERARANGAKLLWAVQGNLDYNAWEHSLGFFAPQMDVSELDFGNEFMQDSFGVEPGEISDERALVKCFDAETEKAVRKAKPPFKLRYRD